MSDPSPNNPKPHTPPAAGQKPAAGQPGASQPRPAAPAGGQPTARPAGTPPAGTPPGGTPAPRPTNTPPGGTPAQRPAQQPTRPAQPSAAKPGQTPAAGTPAARPAAAGARPPAAPPKPAPPKKPVNKFAHIDSNTRQLGQKLLDLGALDEGQLEALYEEMRALDIKLGDLAVERGTITEDQLLQATAELHGMRMANLEETKPEPEAVKLVQETMARLYRMVPISFEGDTLTVAMADPNNLQAVDDIKNLLGIRQVNAVLGPPKQVDALLERAYTGAQEESLASILEQIEVDESSAAGKRKKKRRAGMAGAGETSIDLDDVTEVANSTPVRKLINMVLLMAIRDRASDVHFEPFEDEYKMRYKCDGVLYEMVPPPRHLANAISSRIKVMSNLDIAERRLPQDGRIELNVGGNRVDMRVSVLPTLFGESICIRVLDKSSVGLQLDRIGMPADILGQFRQVMKKPNGIVFVTGPTGSGKTTTLYSALNELNDIETKIITTEDPVEYEIDGIVQCPINHEIDLTFASALRAILRQDPDVILIGEVRDLETAQIAIQASLTGHLVFSTLHTNDAPSSITRLRDMGVEPFLITATVEAIQAQRLVRKVCQVCRTAYTPTKEQLMELNLSAEKNAGRQFYYGEGCDKCNNTGFKGRTGLYELLIMNDDIRDMVSGGSSTDQIRSYCRKQGIQGLRDGGLRALYAGTTTLDEVVRETVMDE